MAILVPIYVFDSRYSRKDRNVIQTAMQKIRFEVYNKMKPLVGEQAIESALNGIKLEFTPDMKHKILGGRALGMAWKDGNVNFCPLNPSRTTITLYSGIFSMEFAHTIFKRLIPKGYTWIDAIHWLYNERYLETISYKSFHNLTHFGNRELKLVLPNVGYAWKNRTEIMEGIRTGKYREGRDGYSSRTPGMGPIESYATMHDLEHIREYLIGH